MVSKKQARAHQAKRRQQLEAKIAERAAKRRKQQRVGGIVALAAIVVTGGALGAGAIFANDEPAPVVTPSATGVQEPSPSAPPAGAQAPDPSVAEGREWTATIDTNLGPIELTLDGSAAPQAVASFVTLARDGYFDETSCHRLTTSGIFVLQCGDPTGTGSGGPDYRFGPVENDPEDELYPRGTLAMARVSGDQFSMGSQFFIVYEDSTIGSDRFEGFGYTVFGQVTSGLDIVDGVAAGGTVSGATDGAPATPVTLNEVSVA